MKATRENPILYIVIPCYNEQEVLPITSKLFLKKITDLVAAGKISDDSRVLFVNDGSKDHTWEIIARLHQENPLFSGGVPVPEPGASECAAGGSDDCPGTVRHHHLHGC